MSPISKLVTKKGVMRPDARDLIDNVGGRMSDPYQGNYPWVYPPPQRTPIMLPVRSMNSAMYPTTSPSLVTSGDGHS